MNVGILGSGVVAQTLAAGWQQAGHKVMMGTRNSVPLAAWMSHHPDIKVGTPSQTAEFADVAVLSVKGTAALAALAAVARQLAGKTVIDTTNPLSDEPPDNGVLRYFTGPNQSLMEQLQRAQPRVRLVKAFNSVGNRRMVQPRYAEGRPTMFICGNQAGAKQQAGTLVHDLGWEVADMGGAAAARAIEPLCMLWCIPGFLQDEWGHAFKLLK